MSFVIIYDKNIIQGSEKGKEPCKIKKLRVNRAVWTQVQKYKNFHHFVNYEEFKKFYLDFVRLLTHFNKMFESIKRKIRMKNFTLHNYITKELYFIWLHFSRRWRPEDLHPALMPPTYSYRSRFSCTQDILVCTPCQQSVIQRITKCFKLGTDISNRTLLLGHYLHQLRIWLDKFYYNCFDSENYSSSKYLKV